MFQPFLITGDRKKDFSALEEGMKHLLEGESNLIAGLANASAFLNWFLEDINWVGFYLYDPDEEKLVLGPFQGLPACVRIPPTKGVCGKAFSEGTVQRIADVLSFPGHIACDGASRSELVIPLFKDSRAVAVLDIDSPTEDRFDETDESGLKRIARLVEALF